MRRFAENEEISFDLPRMENAFEIPDTSIVFLHELLLDSLTEQSIFEVIAEHCC